MKHSIVAAITGLGLVAGSNLLFAQEQPAESPAAAQQTQVSEPQVRKFAEIYVEIEAKRGELSQEMAGAETPQEEQEVQTRMQDEMVSTIESRGWSLAEYNQIANTISNDPQLREQAISHIKQIGT